MDKSLLCVCRVARNIAKASDSRRWVFASQAPSRTPNQMTLPLFFSGARFGLRGGIAALLSGNPAPVACLLHLQPGLRRARRQRAEKKTLAVSHILNPVRESREWLVGLLSCNNKQGANQTLVPCWSRAQVPQEASGWWEAEVAQASESIRGLTNEASLRR